MKMVFARTRVSRVVVAGLCAVAIVVFCWSRLLTVTGPATVSVQAVQVLDPYKVPAEPGPLHCSPLITAKNREHICVYSSEEDQAISKSINDNGLWERDYVLHLIDLMNQDLELGFVDVGVNLGIFTLTMASYGRRVVGVEPLPPNLIRLAQSLRLAPHLIPYVSIISMATSDRSGEVMNFWTPDKHPGGTQLHAASKTEVLEKTASTHHHLGDMSVNSTTLDQILPLLPFKKAILKIDIEGGEYRTFKGANHFFNSVHIPYIFMEWDDKCKPHREVDRKFFINFFRERNYSVHNCTRAMEPLELSEEGCKTWPFDIILRKHDRIVT